MDPTDLDKKDQPKEEMLFNESGQLSIDDADGDEHVNAPLGSMGEQEEPGGKYHRAHQIAAVILIVNSIIIAVETFLLPGESEPIGKSITGILAGIVLGGMLLTKSPKGLKLTRIAVVFGAVAYTGTAVIAGEIIIAVFQLILSGSLILLLFGSPGKGRIITSLVMVSLYGLMAILGVVITAVGDNQVNSAVLEASYDFNEIPGGTLTGHSCAYTLAFPKENNWRSLIHEQVVAENPVADSWAMDTAKDTHVLVIVEILDIDVDKLADAVIRNGSSLIGNFNVVSRLTTQTALGLEGRVVTARGDAEGIAIGYKYGLFRSGGRAYQIMCFTGEDNFPNFEDSCSAIISSFVPAPALPGAPTPEPGQQDSGPTTTP